MQCQAIRFVTLSQGTDNKKMLAFLGILITIEVLHANKEQMCVLGSTDEAIKRSFFFQLVCQETKCLKFIRFDDCKTREERRSKDNPAISRETAELYSQRQYRLCYNRSTNLTMDEKLVPTMN